MQSGKSRKVLLLGMILVTTLSLIVLVPSHSAKAAPSQTTTTISIPGAQPWTDTSIDLTQGSLVSITASGTVYIAGSDPGWTPDGVPTTNCTAGPTFIAPGLPCYSLIGNIANGTPFQVGSSTSFTATVAGRLYLGVNDEFFGDNSGSWTATVTVTPPTNSAKLFIFIQGINSTLSPAQAKHLTVPVEDSFGSKGGIYPFLKKNYPSATFRMFSYNGANNAGDPASYNCQDTFTQHLSVYVTRLKNQIVNYLSNNQNTDVYLIGQSMGGAVALGLLADMRINGYLNINGGKVAGMVSLDSPLGGAPGGFIDSYFTKQNYRKACPALLPKNKPALPLNSLDDLFSTFGTSTSVPLGGFNSIALPLFGADFTNQEIAIDAAANNSPVLTIGNERDWVFNPKKCSNTVVVPDDFSTTEWVADEGNSSGVYGRVFSGGKATCSNLGHIADNHFVVFTQPSVKTAIQQFVNGQTPNALAAVSSGS